MGELVAAWHNDGDDRLPLKGHVRRSIPSPNQFDGLREDLRFAGGKWHGISEDRTASCHWRSKAGVGTGCYGFAFALGDHLLPFARHRLRARFAEDWTDAPSWPFALVDPGRSGHVDLADLAEILWSRMEKLYEPETLRGMVGVLAETLEVGKVLPHDVRGGPRQDDIALYEFHHDAALGVGHVMRPALDLLPPDDVDVPAEQT